MMAGKLTWPKSILFIVLSCSWGPDSRAWAAQGGVALSGLYGYSVYKSTVLNANDVQPVGTSIGGGLEIRGTFVGLEGLYRTTAYNEDVTHNSTQYVLSEKIDSYGVVLKFHLKKIYFKMGYAYHNLNQQVTLGGTPQTDTTLLSTYQAGGEKKGEGMVMGAGLELPIGKIISFIIDAEHFRISNVDATIATVSAGLSFSPGFLNNLAK